MQETADSSKVEAMAKAFADERLRWLIGKGDVLVQRGELTEDRFKELVDIAIREEFERNIILKQIEDGPRSVSKIAKAAKMESDRVLWNLLAMMKWNQVEIVGEEKREYLYAVKEL